MTDTDRITVVVCTRNRSGSLALLLEDLSHQEYQGSWEVLIVDNGSDDDTQRVLSRFRAALPVRAVFEAVAGKARGLNRAIDAIANGWCVFTDDDVRLGRGWLTAYGDAFRRYPESTIFGGPIAPVLPAAAPVWLLESAFAGAAFALFSPDQGEGPLPHPRSPYGPNFVVSRGVIDGQRFDTNLGPPSPHTPMCEDVEFLRRMTVVAGAAVYVPSAGVSHVIRDELVAIPVQCDRAFSLGTSEAAAFGRPSRGAVSARARLHASADDRGQFDRAFALHRLYGEFVEFDRRATHVAATAVLREIRGLEWSVASSYTSSRLVTLLQERPDLVTRSII
jgi:GT2 family glycosyltransferase